MKRIIASPLLLALLVPCCSSTAFASNVITEGETSQRDIQYQEFSFSKEELEQGRVEACTVTVSQPYSYSTEIPKNNWDHETIINDSSVPKSNMTINTNNTTNKKPQKNNGLVDIQDDPVPKNNKPVQTGDETPIIIYLSMGILGAVGMMGLKAKSRKTKK